MKVNIEEKIHFEWKTVHNGDGKVPNIRLNSASWLYKEYLWLICGAGAGQGKSSQIWRFSLSDKTWDIVNCTGISPSCRDGHSGTYVGNGKFVVFGGQGFPEPNSKIEKASIVKTYHKREVFNDLYQFDCDNLSWTPIYPDGLNAPMGRRGHCAMYITPYAPALLAAKIAEDNNDNASFGTGSMTSSSSTYVSTVRGGSLFSSHNRAHGATVTEFPTNTLLVFGGSGIELSKYTEQLYGDLWSFSLTTNIWTRIETNGEQARPVFDHRMVRIGDLMVMVGGITGVNKPVLATGPGSKGGAKSMLTSGGTLNTDIMLLNLRTCTWSNLKIWDQYGQPARFNFHGFSLVVDQPMGPVANPLSVPIFIFGGNQVVDSKSASTTKAASCHVSYPDDNTLVLNIQDCTLLPMRSLQADAQGPAPENRYGHTGVSCTCVEQLFALSIAPPSTSRQVKKAERAKTRKSMVDIIPEQQTIEPIMYVYGGAGIERGGFPDPLLFQLVRVRTEIVEQPFLPTLAGAAAASLTEASKADGESTPGGIFDEDGMRRPRSTPGGSRPGSPSSFFEDTSYNPFGSSTPAGGHGGHQDGRANIWHSMQTKVGHVGEPRPPSNWSEMKLSLTAPFSQRVFETDRFENEEVMFDTAGGSSSHHQSAHTSPSKWGTRRATAMGGMGGGSNNQFDHHRMSLSAPVFGHSDMHDSLRGSLDQHAFGGSRGHSRSPLSPGVAHGLSQSQVLVLNTRNNSRVGTANSSNYQQFGDTVGGGGSMHRPFTSPGLTPLSHNGLGHSASMHSALGATSGGGAHMAHPQDPAIVEMARQARIDRIKHMTAALKPVVRHKTKIAAKGQFLKLFPHHAHTESL